MKLTSMVSPKLGGGLLILKTVQLLGKQKLKQCLDMMRAGAHKIWFVPGAKSPACHWFSFSCSFSYCYLEPKYI